MLLTALRKTKHAGFLATKRGRRSLRAARFATLTLAGTVTTKVRPYMYDGSRYRRSFLNRGAAQLGGESMLPARVFVLWTGDNPLPPNRLRNLERLRAVIGLPVEFVMPENLDKWLVPGHPLHPSYPHLSLVHRSDYLRAYLMHHHGGGYCDLKAPLRSWAAVHAQAAADQDAWITGFRELSAASAVRVSGALGRDIALHHRRLVGTAAFLMRSHTPLSAEWLREVERRLDYFGPQAAEHPGEVRGEVVGYPVSWTDLLGKVLQPLQLKYLDHVRVDDRLLLEFTDYQ